MASIDINQFRERVKINKHDLDGEIEIHSQSLERIGREVAQLGAKVDELKNEYERVEGVMIGRAKLSDEKITNPQADKMAKNMPEYIRAWRNYLDAKREHGEWVALLESWKSRGFGLRTLADLHGQQYFTVDSTARQMYKQHDREADQRFAMRQAAEAKRKEREVGAQAPVPPTTERVRRRLPT